MSLPSSFKFLISVDTPDNNPGNKFNKHGKELQKTPAEARTQFIELNVEADRLKTFKNWDVAFISKHTLALLGFYKFAPSDMVKCYFCGVEIGMWEENDDVLVEHMRWSPSCSLIRRNQTNNIPISETLLDQTLPPAPKHDVYGATERATTISEGSIDTLSDDDVHM